MIDRRNHHLFQPLLYQVAMAGLNPSDIATPIRRLFSKNKNVVVTLAEVENVDTSESKIFYDGSWKQYDYLIFACGAKHFYFGKNDWENIAPGLKNIEQATEIRRRVLTAFEMAEKENDPTLQNAYLSFVIIGGGPTGVELAGAISEMARKTLKDDFKLADLKQTKVYLIEAGPRILPSFPESLSAKAEQDLEEMGVHLIKNTLASDLSPAGLKAGEQWIEARTIIWAAGVKPSSISEKMNTPKDPQGRIKTQKDLSLPNNPKVFAIGDMSAFPTAEGKGLPGVAPVAVQQGKWVARQILNDLQNKTREDFVYWDKGMMATIGRSRAVVCSGKLQLTGFVAWVTWVFVHIVYLMQFRNKVFVFYQWVWSYFRFGRGARLIIHKNWRFYSGKKINYENETP